MIAPLAHTPRATVALRGVIWYQGEQNSVVDDQSGGPAAYECLFRALIADWRQHFGTLAGSWRFISFNSAAG